MSTQLERIAGTALDVEIAERVMEYEWRRSRSTGRRCLYAPGQAPEHMQQFADGTEALVGDWESHRWTPRYSEDIAAAFLVVEAMRAKGWYMSMSDSRHGCYRLEANGPALVGWWIQVSYHEPGFEFPADLDVSASADTLPLAICLAALAAIETPVGGSA